MSTVFIIIASLILLFVVYSVYTMRKLKNMKEVPQNEKIVTLTKTNFDHQVKNGLVLIDFWAGWCMPCKMLAPVINEVADEVNGVAKVGKVNVEVEKEIASRFSIRSIPTLILLKNGKEQKRFVGVKTKDFLVKQINQIK